MISELIQTKLSSVIPNTFISVADEGTQTPFCIHNERQVPVRLKEGIIGYEHECEIIIIDDSPDSVENYKKLIIQAIESLEGQTDDDCRVESVNYTGDEPGFDKESKLYLNILLFQIETSNL